jgi:outer membrane immunogenic protein
MKTIVAALLLTLAAPASGVLAADITEPEPIQELSGFYVGAGVGWNNLDRDFDSDQLGVTSACLIACDIEILSGDDDGELTGHILAGYLIQTGMIGIAIEADYTFGDVDPWDSPTCAPPVAGFCAVLDATEKIEQQGHLRFLAGVDLGPVFPFVAIGAAIARFESSLIAYGLADGGTAQKDTISDSETEVGLSLGAGIQARLAEHISIRGEFIMDDYGDVELPEGTASVAVGGGSGALVFADGDDPELTNKIARFSVIWNF